jgi:hypothetical protein
MPKYRWYVAEREDGSRTAFLTEKIPTTVAFAATRIIGPFITRRAAEICAWESAGERVSIREYERAAAREGKE